MSENQEAFLRCLPVRISSLLKRHGEILEHATEIRLRRGRPLGICFGEKLYCLGEMGLTAMDQAFIVTDKDMLEAWRLVTSSSVYAMEEELKRGYITLQGGHRVGVAGTAVLSENKVRTQKDISSLNYRFAREKKGVGAHLLPLLFEGDRFLDTLIFSPPGAGKTTLLRDLARLISEGGDDRLPRNVSIVDERGEIAGTSMGRPCYDVGPFTDILHGFPKSEGMMLALRSLAPQIIVTDEIGGDDDRKAVADAVRCGTHLLLSAHGGTLAELQVRPVLRELLTDGVFLRLIKLSAIPHPGTVDKVYRRISTEGCFDYVEVDPVFYHCDRSGSRRHSAGC